MLNTTPRRNIELTFPLMKKIVVRAEDFKDLKYEVNVQVSQEKLPECNCWLCEKDPT